MKKLIKFIIDLVNEVHKDDLFSLGGELAYKLLLALFPFLIFLLTLLGFLNLDSDYFVGQLGHILPPVSYELVKTFIDSIVNEKNPSIMSTSLLVSFVSSASGARAIMRGINRTYGEKENRGFIKLYSISFILVFILIFTIFVQIIFYTFGSTILKALEDAFAISGFAAELGGFFSSVAATLILVLMTMFIYRMAYCKKITLRSTFPGASFTVICWAVSSKLFNVYLYFFPRMSTVYGSIGSVFILLLWLNIISVVLMVGSEINALLDRVISE